MFGAGTGLLKEVSDPIYLTIYREQDTTQDWKKQCSETLRLASNSQR